VKQTLAVILLLSFILCSFPTLAVADGIPNLTDSNQRVAVEDSKIPNAAAEKDHGTNGRPQKLDKRGNVAGDELNPVERRIITRDAIISNAPALAN